MRAVISEDQNAAVIFTDARTLYLKAVPRRPGPDSCCGCAAFDDDFGCLMTVCADRSYCGRSRRDKRRIAWKEVAPS